MGVGKLIGGAVKVGVAAVAVAGVYTLFKDEIRETKTYKKANEKYDVDTKMEKATATVKNTVVDAAKTVSAMKEKWAPAEDESVAEDEIILEESESAEREYVSLDTEAAPADPSDIVVE